MCDEIYRVLQSECAYTVLNIKSDQVCKSDLLMIKNRILESIKEDTCFLSSFMFTVFFKIYLQTILYSSIYYAQSLIAYNMRTAEVWGIAQRFGIILCGCLAFAIAYTNTFFDKERYHKDNVRYERCRWITKTFTITCASVFSIVILFALYLQQIDENANNTESNQYTYAWPVPVMVFVCILWWMYNTC